MKKFNLSPISLIWTPHRVLHYNNAIIPLGLDALLLYLLDVMMLLLFFVSSSLCIGLVCVVLIVTFSGHTHLLFWSFTDHKTFPLFDLSDLI